MTKVPPPRFDIDALRHLIGDKVFARRLAYHQGGQVTILAIKPIRGARTTAPCLPALPAAGDSPALP